MTRPHNLGKFEPLQQALLYYGLDGTVFATDVNAIKRPMDATAAGVGLEHLADGVGSSLPITVEQIGVGDILDFEVALIGQNPIEVLG
jgi:hypothetical protein